MPTMQDSVSVAANAVSPNQLAGQDFEFIFGRPRRVRALATGSATGLRATVKVNNVAVVSDQAIGLQNRFPIIPDDILQEFTAAGRLSISFRNTTAGALTAFWRVDIE
jgi:hypothetical protein